MTVKSLIDRVIDNWPAKITCFAIAILLFLFHQMSSLERKYYSIPLKIYAEGELVPASTYPRVVRVSIRGEPEEINTILENDITAFVDLNYYTEPGVYNVPVQIQLSSSAVSVNPLEVQVDPQEIVFTLEKRLIAFVPVSPSFSGNPAAGYEISGYTATPAIIEISGPRSVVEKVTEVFSDSISIANKTSSFSATAALLNHNMLVTLKGDSSARFNIEITPKLITHTFVNVSVYYKDLPPGLTVSAQIEPLSITARGPVNQLEDYTFSSEEVFADCSKIRGPGEYTLPVVVQTDPSFKISAIEPPLIRIHVSDKNTAAAGEKPAAQEQP